MRKPTNQRKPRPARAAQEQEPMTPAAMATQLTEELTKAEQEIAELDAKLQQKKQDAAYLRGQLHMLSRIQFSAPELEHGTDGQDGE